MKWNQHLNLTGSHALFGASQYYWINYDIDKLKTVYRGKMAAAEETKHKKRLELLKQVDEEIVTNGKEQVDLAKRQYELAVWYAE